MRNQAGVIGAAILGVLIMVVTVGPSSALPQSGGGIAIVAGFDTRSNKTIAAASGDAEI